MNNMFYIYSIVIPVIIIVLGFYFNKIKLHKFVDYVNVLLKTVPYLFTYTLLLYFLEMENYLSSGWGFYSIMFFLIPATSIMVVIKVINGMMK